MKALKEELYKLCVARVDERLLNAENAMRNIQAAANEETKSSAGDKYETGRAMMHLEKEKLAEQLADASKMKVALGKIEPEKSNDKIGLGSLVKTPQAIYFIAVSLGLLKLNNKSAFVISPISPIGQAMIDKKKGDVFSFGGKTVEIEEVW